ncbi:hypothetical protein T4D_6025 [Trichinella pseudospiralis]|uniref:Uncharacterized protein n=1 Tax=Trichinella pseudospiralis TaxID=6337 RepID=A0A0V1DU79_TRIPS|nr:hypothetical protein T4D_6025 [Trichinella pseudospiralis]
MEEAEEDGDPIGRPAVSTNPDPWELQRWEKICLTLKRLEAPGKGKA